MVERPEESDIRGIMGNPARRRFESLPSAPVYADGRAAAEAASRDSTRGKLQLAKVAPARAHRTLGSLPSVVVMCNMLGS